MCSTGFPSFHVVFMFSNISRPMRFRRIISRDINRKPFDIFNRKPLDIFNRKPFEIIFMNTFGWSGGNMAPANWGLGEIDGLFVPPGKASNLLSDHPITG